MQVDGAAHGVGAIPRRKRLNVLLAIVAVVIIAAMVALMVWAPPLVMSGVGAQDAKLNAGAGTAIIHDDAGNLPEAGVGSAVVHDDAGNLLPQAASAVVHDDAGNLKP